MTDNNIAVQPAPAVTPDAPTEKEQKRIIRSLAWRGILLQGAFNYERFQNLGFWWMLRPELDRLYPEKEERAAAYRRHLTYFNTNAWVVGPIAGVVATMEQRRAKGETEIADEAITSVKVGLMAPLAGIGDSLIFGTIRPILAAVCAALAIQGNVLGPIIFFLGLLATQIAMRVWGTSVGYRTGTKFISQIGGPGLEKLKEGATIVGLAVTGALVATLLKIKTPFTYTSGDASIALQDQLDAIVPALLPLLATLAVYWLIRKRVSPVWVLVGALLVGLVAGFFGILG
jgi:mannose/fructose/sorbose-specific phosphotransferase system IID component